MVWPPKDPWLEDFGTHGLISILSWNNGEKKTRDEKHADEVILGLLPGHPEWGQLIFYTSVASDIFPGDWRRQKKMGKAIIDLPILILHKKAPKQTIS